MSSCPQNSLFCTISEYSPLHMFAWLLVSPQAQIRILFLQNKARMFISWSHLRHFYNIIKIKRNRSLNTNNGLLAKMESTYVTTCFGLHLWPSSCYNLVAPQSHFHKVFSSLLIFLNGSCPAKIRLVDFIILSMLR